jgi:hypothetical protein
MEEFGDRTIFLRGQNILGDRTGVEIPCNMKLLFFFLRIF